MSCANLTIHMGFNMTAYWNQWSREEIFDYCTDRDDDHDDDHHEEESACLIDGADCNGDCEYCSYIG